MEQAGDVTRVPISLTHGCIVASIQVDLDDEILRTFRRDLLERIRRENAAGVILDLSGAALMDAEDFEALRGCIAMAELMGARSVVVGLQPGVVSALIDMDVDTDGIEATLDLEEAFSLLRPQDASAPDEEADKESGREVEPEELEESAPATGEGA
jgi:rsbT antagonist protein RsbS